MDAITQPRFEASIWSEGQARTVAADHFDVLPRDRILSVSIIYPSWRHNLIGADYYWCHGGMYGMVYDGSCCPAGSVTWLHGEDGAQAVDLPAPDGAIMLEGILLPDDVWERVR